VGTLDGTLGRTPTASEVEGPKPTMIPKGRIHSCGLSELSAGGISTTTPHPLSFLGEESKPMQYVCQEVAPLNSLGPGFSLGSPVPTKPGP
jgi:hypothetical protein